jgi:hypothetical protein
LIAIPHIFMILLFNLTNYNYITYMFFSKLILFYLKNNSPVVWGKSKWRLRNRNRIWSPKSLYPLGSVGHSTSTANNGELDKNSSIFTNLRYIHLMILIILSFHNSVCVACFNVPAFAWYSCSTGSI